MRRPFFATALVLASSALIAHAEPPVLGTTPSESPPPDLATAPAASAIEADDKSWEFSLTLTGYLVPDDRDYIQPTFTADYDTLHLELRYNYEDLDTGSVWVGYNFAAGEEFTVEFTPMFGVVQGDTDGVSPGYKLALGYGMLELYTEGQYLFDLEESSDNFFYTWTELSLAPVDWFRFGLVIQRTKAYDSDFDIDRGLLVGFSIESIDITTYIFNMGWDDPTFVLAVGIEF
jgi:hypothetical protein